MTRSAREEEVGLLQLDLHDEKCPPAIASYTPTPPDQTEKIEPTEDDTKTSWRALPQKNQLLLLALCRLSTPLSNACLLPYIYPLVASILATTSPSDPTPQQITRLTGLLIAAYPLGQAATSLPLSHLSTRIGRKPTILLALTLSALANFAFGFSSSVAALLAWRVVAGMANGATGVMRTMTTEIVGHRKWNARAFLAMPVVFNSGRVAALLVGGFLADPGRYLGWGFGKEGIFNFWGREDGVEWVRIWPYALPAVVNGAVILGCAVCAGLGLRETLEGTAGVEDVKRWVVRVAKGRKGYVAVEDEEKESDHSNAYSGSEARCDVRPRLRSIWTRKLMRALVSFALLPLHNTSFLHIFPVFLSMPTQESTIPSPIHSAGGMGFSPRIVGVSLAIVGILGIFIQLFLYPRLQKRIGTLGVFRLANTMFPLAYTAAPFLVLLAGHQKAKWPAVGAILLLQVMARTMAIPSSIVLLTEAAPGRHAMGTVHGTGNMLGALASAVGPVMGGVILAWGIEIGVVGLVWWCWLLTVALGALAWSFVVKNEGAGTAKGLEI